MSSLPDPVDRRAHPRLAVELPLTWRRQHFDREEPARPARALDISEGGVRLELGFGDVLHLGEVLELELSGGAPTPIQRRGLVVSTHAGVHVAFRESPDGESLLTALGLTAAT
jgi:hypothetical protein